MKVKVHTELFGDWFQPPYDFKSFRVVSIATAHYDDGLHVEVVTYIVDEEIRQYGTIETGSNFFGGFEL